ncbi:MAG: DUF4290 domain-containing protein [Phycisphaerales bacterium]|nr:DUF4290 domain-containing protein [Phycisphaerales bacterium]
MEYNSSRGKLLMPQYGRNVQKMVEYLLSIEDREKRLQQANLVIQLMSLLTPHLKTLEDYEHKLWDHLHQMTGFRLDVDGPFPAPTEEQLTKKPDPLPYPQSPIKHRHLGRNLQTLIAKGLADEQDKKQGYTQSVGYYMKLAYTNWHNEPVHDDMVKNELSIITGGEMKFEGGGYKIPFDPRANFKNNNGGGGRNNFKNKNNRKGGGGNNNNGGGNKNNNNKSRNFKNK